MHLLLLLLLAASCGIDTGGAGNTPAPRPVLPAPRCARPVGAGYYDDQLGTACTFGAFDGKRVCIPDNMPRVISGVCNPAGGLDRIWIDRAGCGGDGSSRYALSTNTKSCGELKGPIEVISTTPAPDQNVYLVDPQTKSCTPSGLVARSNSPIVDRAPSPPAPFYIYAADLAAQPCETR